MIYTIRISMMILFILQVQLSVSQETSDENTMHRGEVLYNGIQLPEVWPPDQLDPLSDDPMRVPYLENPPAVIPIDIGRQLFVDDFLIEKTNLSREFHRARKYEGNPVFHPETKQELDVKARQQAVAYLGHGGVFYDPEDEVFKMFYTAGWRGGLALAVSKNLTDWERTGFESVNDNLVLPPGPLFAGGDNAIWIDENAKDPNEKYKMIVERLVDGGWKQFYENKSDAPTHTLHTSPDGLVWSQGLPTGRAADYTSFFYNPFRDIWAFSIKQNTKRGRARYYSENKNFLRGRNWSASVYWTNADKLDLPDSHVGDPAQLYSLNAVAYESLILGEFYIHLGPENSIADKANTPKITEIELGFSRDGFHWSRPDRSPFIAATRKEGDWDRAYLHGTNGILLVIGDELWFPYTGYSGMAPNKSRGMYTGAGIGMAILRRDGFASMQTKKKNGMLVTRPVTFQGNHLFVNVNCPEGKLTVEILDQDDNVIAPFSRTNCTPIKVDKTLHMVKWGRYENLSDLKEQPVKFRFQLSNGELYSFWVSPDKKGASHGYLGGGNPVNKGKVDTMGVMGY